MLITGIYARGYATDAYKNCNGIGRVVASLKLDIAKKVADEGFTVTAALAKGEKTNLLAVGNLLTSESSLVTPVAIDAEVSRHVFGNNTST